MSGKTLVRVASGSSIKLDGTRMALGKIHWVSEVVACPTELQDTEGFNAQPYGLEETRRYVRARYRAMCEAYKPNPDGVDIVVESGAIDGKDVACVLVAFRGQIYTGESQPVPFPEGTLVEAHRRGFKTVTAGAIIHEKLPGVPANNWHHIMVPGMTREKQIAGVLLPILRRLME